MYCVNILCFSATFIALSAQGPPHGGDRQKQQSMLQPVSAQALVLYQYETEETDEISLVVGQHVSIIEEGKLLVTQP